jgi:hypothetical protein
LVRQLQQVAAEGPVAEPGQQLVTLARTPDMFALQRLQILPDLFTLICSAAVQEHPAAMGPPVHHMILRIAK